MHDVHWPNKLAANAKPDSIVSLSSFEKAGVCRGRFAGQVWHRAGSVGIRFRRIDKGLIGPLPAAGVAQGTVMKRGDMQMPGFRQGWEALGTHYDTRSTRFH